MGYSYTQRGEKGSDRLRLQDMKASRDTDLIIAQHMGWKWDGKVAISPTGSRCDMQQKDPYWWLPYYTSDMTAAWELAEKLDMWVIVTHDIKGNRTGYCAMPYKTRITARANSAPLAICKAFLKAQEVTEI